MANKRIKDLATTATSAAADDHVALDGATNKTRKGLFLTLLASWRAATTFPPVIGSGAGDAVAGNDARLTDSRTPSGFSADGISFGQAADYAAMGALLPIVRTFGITVDGAGAALTAGSKGFLTVPYSCAITNWYLAADQAGDVVFDVKRGGTSIIGTGNAPTLSTAQSGNAAVSGWDSVAVAEGEVDILEFEITGTPASITRVNLVLKAS